MKKKTVFVGMAALLLTFGLLLAGCANDDDNGGGSSTSSPELEGNWMNGSTVINFVSGGRGTCNGSLLPSSFIWSVSGKTLTIKEDDGRSTTWTWSVSSGKTLTLTDDDYSQTFTKVEVNY